MNLNKQLESVTAQTIGIRTVETLMINVVFFHQLDGTQHKSSPVLKHRSVSLFLRFLPEEFSEGAGLLADVDLGCGVRSASPGHILLRSSSLLVGGFLLGHQALMFMMGEGKMVSWWHSQESINSSTRM